MPTATADDVKGVIPTDLSDADIENYLDDAQFANEQANDVDEMSTTEIRQLEKYLAALYIVQSKDRPIDQGSKESASITYGGDTVAWLQSMVNERDPSGSLAYQRDTNRHVNSTA